MRNRPRSAGCRASALTKAPASSVDVDGRPGKAMADQIMAADQGHSKSRLGVLSKPDRRDVEDAIPVHLDMPR